MEGIRIVSYCTPDEEFELDWLDGYPGFNIGEQEEEFDFFNRIDNAVESFFRKALAEMEPLLRDINVEEIQVVSDYSGIITPPGTVAHWNYARSKPENGRHTLVASPSLISRSLHLAQNPSFDPGSNAATTWQHELIHLVDQEAIIHSDKWRQYSSDNMILRKYLSGYREEGIADLWFLGKGHSRVNNFSSARERFNVDLDRINEMNTGSFKDRKAYGRAVTDTKTFYAAGPMMVLHALCVSDEKETANQAACAAEKIAAGEILTNEELFFLIRAAVKMDIETFMSALEMPGPDGLRFASLKKMEEAIVYPKPACHEDAYCSSL